MTSAPHRLSLLALFPALLVAAPAIHTITLHEPETPTVIINAATGMPSNASLWSPGKTTVNLESSTVPTPTNDAQVIRLKANHPLMALCLRQQPPLPLDSTLLAFTYYLPPDSRVKSIHPAVRIEEENGKLHVIRLPAIKGRWQTEQIHLSALISGDVWRGGKPATVRQLELGIVAPTGESLDIQLAEIRLSRQLRPFAPLVRPEWLTGSGTAIRDLAITAQPTRAWLMAYATTGCTITVNGQPLNDDARLRPGWPINPNRLQALEWSLDGRLAVGDNRIAITIQDGKDARAIIALGWEDDTSRHVVVSDAAWTINGATATTSPLLPDGKRRLNWLDIYPIRPPSAWRPADKPTDVSGLPSFRPTSPKLSPRPQLGRWTTAQAPDGRHYLRAPDGQLAFFNGIQVVGLLYENYAYNDWARHAFPNLNAWAENALTLIHRLGFNGLAVAATDDAAFQAGARRGMPYFHFIAADVGGSPLLNAQGQALPHMPDPFNPQWRAFFRQRAEKIAQKWNADPACIGYFVTNEIHLEGNLAGTTSTGFVYSPDCGREFVRWLRERYANDLKTLNLAWFGNAADSYLRSFEDIHTRKIDPIDKNTPFADSPEAVAAMAHIGQRLSQPADALKAGRLRRDFEDFAVHTTRVFATFVLDTLRELTPDKLIGSNRFMGAATGEMYAAWKDYDIIAINSYPDNQLPQYSDRQLAEFDKCHRATGKPVMLTEWGIQSLDVRLPSPAATLYTQTERGQGYAQLMRQVVQKCPYMLGMVSFAYQHLADSEGQGWGLVDNHGQPFADYAKGIADAHRWLDQFFK